MCGSNSSPDPGHDASRRDILRRLMGLGLTMPAAMAALRHAATAAPGPMSYLDQKEFIGGLQDLIARAKSPELAGFSVFQLGSTDMPWKTINLEATKGQEVTFLLGGRIWLSREYDLWAEPGAGFHARSLGKRPIYNPMSNTGTMMVADDGGIEIARSLAEFKDEDGALWTPKADYQGVEVDMYGVALAWRGDAARGMRSLMAHGDVDGVLGAELTRYESPRKLPDGWNNLFMLGGGPIIFNDIGHGEIACQTHKNAGILEYPVAMDLKPGTKLSWRWIIEELPSRVAEDQAATHDYLSIGAKFDDGQDLTYIWSHSLPVGKAFRCPLARWTPIETHKIIRSGPENLGTWVGEEQDLHADYTAHIGGKAKSITQVWLLGVSVFQRLNGAYRVRDIQITGPDQSTKL
jgi:Protein of unknown function (DUF3047)